MYYWNNKEERAKKAQLHTEEMAKKYPQQINNSIKNTIIYDDNSSFENTPISEKNIFVKQQTTSEAIASCNSTITALNFASFHNAGGKFLNGSSAQEESLCHDSFLYNVISTFTDFYEHNHTMKNKGMYTNRALYSPNIIFNDKYVNIITCASPNKSLLYKYGNFTEEENSQALQQRINFICNIVKNHSVDTLILGAFGCGVFKQNPKEVAQLFLENLDTLPVNNVIFAIPDKPTFIEFKNIIH